MQMHNDKQCTVGQALILFGAEAQAFTLQLYFWNQSQSFLAPIHFFEPKLEPKFVRVKQAFLNYNLLVCSFIFYLSQFLFLKCLMFQFAKWYD